MFFKRKRVIQVKKRHEVEYVFLCSLCKHLSDTCPHKSTITNTILLRLPYMSVTCIQPRSDLPTAEICLCASHCSLLIARINGIQTAGKEELQRNLQASPRSLFLIVCFSGAPWLSLFSLSSPVQRLHNTHQLFSSGLWVSSAKPITDGALC